MLGIHELQGDRLQFHFSKTPGDQRLSIISPKMMPMTCMCFSNV